MQMDAASAERKGWSLTWLVLLVAVVVALPAMIFSQFVLLSILCLFLAGIGLARRRFTPASVTVLVATATIFASTLGESIFDPASYQPYETFKLPPDLQQTVTEHWESGKAIDSSLRRRMATERMPTGTGARHDMYVVCGLARISQWIVRPVRVLAT